MPVPFASVDFPGSLAEVRAWFPDDDACLDYLAWLRWGEFEFVCHLRGNVDGWRSSSGYSWECSACKAHVYPTAGTIAYPTAGTIAHRTRTPLTVLFEAAWAGHHPGVRGQRPGLAARPRHVQLPDRVDDASQVPTGDGGPEPLAVGRALEADEVLVGGSMEAGAGPGRSAKPGVSTVAICVERRTRHLLPYPV